MQGLAHQGQAPGISKYPLGTRRRLWLLGFLLVLGLCLVLGVNLFLRDREARVAQEDFRTLQLNWTAACASLLQSLLEDVAPGATLPMERLSSLQVLEQPETLQILLRSPDRGWITARGGDFFPAPGRELPGSEGSWHTLLREEALALGLPPRTTALSYATATDRRGRSWKVAVAGSAFRERERAQFARYRLLASYLAMGGFVLALGAWALRLQRRELRLGQELELREASRLKDQELSQANRAATVLTFASGVAHEISTPLGVIAGRAAQMALRTEGDARLARNAQAIQEEVQRIHRTLRRFLDLARGGPAVQEELHPGNLVGAAVALVAHRFLKAGVRLQVEVPPDLPILRGDGSLLEQLLVNLLLNACDASSPEEAVVILAGAVEGRTFFEVLDADCGIPQDHLERVGEPFFTTKPRGKGTGMGLAIAKEIVSMHHGTLALDPRQPRGTRARVELP